MMVPVRQTEMTSVPWFVSSEEKKKRFQFFSGQRHILYVDNRDNSVDNGIFIHAIVPRHVETVALLRSE